MRLYLLFGLCALLLGFFLDLLIGDPAGKWHPVISIGSLINKMEKVLRRTFPENSRGEFAGGVCLVVIVSVVSCGIPLLLLMAGYYIYRPAGFLLETIMCYYILATKSLKTESMKVAKALEEQGLTEGRRAVSMIVGRDTENLTEEGVVKAAVETVAENTSDGVIAPMLYLAIGGPVLGFLYKAVNTMDSMLGYKNERYLYFGRAAAKTDDAVNYIPARLSAGLMILSSCFCGLSFQEALRIYKRDCKKAASPNACQTEAVMAGALKVQLAGEAWYFGEKHEKPTIGDPIKKIDAGDIRRANRLLYAAAVLGLVIFSVLKLLIIIW